MWVFQQMCQVSMQCVVKRCLWLLYSSPPSSRGLQEAGEGPCLQKAYRHTLQGKCTLQGKKNMLPLQLAEGLWCPVCFCCGSADLLAHTSAGLPLAEGSRGCQGPQHSPCWKEG